MQGGPEPSLQTFGTPHSLYRFRPLRRNHNHVMCCCRQRNRRHRLGVHLLPQLRSKRSSIYRALPRPANLKSNVHQGFGMGAWKLTDALPLTATVTAVDYIHNEAFLHQVRAACIFSLPVFILADRSAS